MFFAPVADVTPAQAMKDLEVLPEAQTDFVFRWWYDWNVTLIIICIVTVGIIWWHVRRKR